jgi:hypothetical protein
VRPGESVRATLAGRARLRATVLGPDGTPVPRYRLTVQQTAPYRTSRDEELQSATTAPPAAGVYRGLLEGSYEVSVTAEGYGEHRGQVEGLSADRVYELGVRLAPAGTLRGRVVHDDGTPVTHGAVQFTLGEVAGHDMDPSAMMTAMVNDEHGARQVNVPYRDRSVALAADGSFDLGEVAAGPAVLRVVVGDWIRHDTVLASAARTEPLVVTMPRFGSVTGRVAFGGKRPDGDIRLRPKLQAELMQVILQDAKGDLSGAVDAEGRYHFGPLLAGATELTLIARGADTGHGFSGMTPLARVRVDVAPGEPTNYDIDLAFKRPTTRVAVTVTIAGEASPQALGVQLVPRDVYDALGREQKGALGKLEAGRVVLDAVAAGEYRVEVSRTPQGIYEVEQALTVTPEQVAAGKELSLTIDVPGEGRAPER